MIWRAIPTLTVALFVAAVPVGSRDGLLARIGDVDGFGYGVADGLKAANRKAANLHNHEVLSNGDFLPDLNRNGTVAEKSADDFDLRSEAERDDTGNTFGEGVVKTTGTVGSKYTDISLSRSYGTRSAAKKIQVRDEQDQLVFGEGGPFPHPPSKALPIQPGFVFQFEISKKDLAGQTPIYFNMVFGDYDVSPAKIRVTRCDGTLKNLDVKTQPKAEDGLIQAATTTLDFNDVFQDGGKVWKGSLKVDFLAPNEPYTAFDYVELNTKPLIDPQQTPEEENPSQIIQQRRSPPRR
jgi:hypothetical protein